MAPKQRTPKVSRNPDLVCGVSKYSRSKMYHKQGLLAIKAKNGSIFPRHDAQPKAPAPAAKAPKFYPADDVKKPLVNKRKPKPTKLSSNTELALYEASCELNYGTKPNAYALVHLVRASTNLGYYSYGNQLHSYILRSGFVSNVFVSAALVRFYVKDSLSDAHKLFAEIPQPSVVSWNTLISGYVHSGRFSKALDLFIQLERSDIFADSFTFTAALAACGQLCLLQLVIAASARNGLLVQAFGFLQQMPNPDTISYNELINGLAHFGDIEDAIHIMSTMPSPNSSSWNSIITGYVNRDRAREALNFFCRMHSKDIEMDQFTFSSILSGIAGLSALTWGMLIHCCTIKCGLGTSIVVGSALVDVYSKCGRVKNAEFMFQSLPIKNLVTWNAMISGFALNGDSTKVIQLFEQLKMERDVKPDGITFLNVLSACSHNQVSLEIATQYFESMMEDYGIEPTAEHCCSMIRLMGQRGEVWRAERMIFELGFGSCGLVWRALLGACGACGNLKLARTAASMVLKLEGDDDYVYVMLSNIYALYGKWGHVREVRESMRKKQVRKEAGRSWIVVDNVNANLSFLR
nr:putative pentatricopeptide repeat-containing protein [Quercus suber]